MFESQLAQDVTVVTYIVLAVMAIFSPLFFGLLLPYLRRPYFGIEFQQAEPFCRHTNTNQVSKPTNVIPSYWVRLRIHNRGHMAAKSCRGKVVSIYSATGRKLPNVDPMQLHWVTTSWGDVPFRDIDLDRSDYDYLGVLMTQQGDRKAYIAGDQFPLWTNFQPRGIQYWLDPGNHIFQVAVYGDGVAPLTRYLVVRWGASSPDDMTVSLFTSLNEAQAAIQ